MFRVNYITQDLCFFENAETNGSDWPALSLLRGVSEGQMIQFAIHKKEPLRAELEAFVSMINSHESQIVSGKDGQAALLLAMTLVESALSRQVIEVADYVNRRAETRQPVA
jgi:predicted dehydrogenase